MDNQQLAISLDLEDHRPSLDFPKRYPDITRRLLDLLAERGIRATVFVLGRVAKESPELIREIAERGHEVAYHSAQHVHLTYENIDNFIGESTHDLKYISDLIGMEVRGYRAPAFSLTPKSAWAIDAIKTLGFKYSSSVMPVKNPINGFPGAPRQAFYWPNKLLEIPASVAKVGPVSLPYLGGIYLRYLPMVFIRYLLRHEPTTEEKWIYCHPHDFDHEEAFFQIEGTSFLVSVLLWFNRRGTFDKLMRLLPDEVSPNIPQTFAEKLDAGSYANAPCFAFKG